VGALIATAIVLTSGCVAHPVGPARTFSKYEGKAKTTAEAALSAVETARLAAQLASDGRAFGPYTSAVLSESEAAASGADGTFASIQPPDARADELREELASLLTEAVGHLADLRIAARRGHILDLDEVAKALAKDAEQLRAFVEAHQ
jgi:hypothetical protein